MESIHLAVHAGKVTPDFCFALRDTLDNHPGATPVYLRLETTDDVKVLLLNQTVDDCALLHLLLADLIAPVGYY